MKDNAGYLRHIRDAIARIHAYTVGGRQEFLARPMVQDAVMRKLEIIGEAVSKLSPEFKRRHPRTPWRRITALRNVLIHEYFGVDIEIVWGVVEKRLPLLKRQIDALLRPGGRPG